MKETKMISEMLYHTAEVSRQIIALNPPAQPAVVAYLDPGTGSLIIQMAIGIAVGGLVTLKVFWKRVTVFCKNLVGGSKRDEVRN